MASWKLVLFCSILLVCDLQAGNVDTYSSHTLFRNILSAISEINETERLVSDNSVKADSLSEVCSKHREFYQQALFKFETWATYMFDSATKFPFGLEYGMFTHMGNYDECIKVKDIAHADGSVFHGKHCLATIQVDTSTKSAGSAAALPLRTAVCVPSTCNMEDVGIIAAENFQQILQAALPGIGSMIEVRGVGDELFCHTYEKPDFKTSDWIAVAIFAIFGAAVILSTAYDVLTTTSEKRSNLLLAFSAYTNGKRLLATSSGADNLGCLHGIRFLSIIWIVLGHRYMDALTAPSVNILEFMNDLFPAFRYLYITNAQLAVDTFFVLSGLLVAYVFFRTVPKTNSFNIPLYYMHRYIRLTPAFAAVVLLESTLLFYAGSGPLWESQMKPLRQNCEDNWWANLLYIQNFYDAEHECVGQSWYLAVDMQLYWLSPLVLVPLWKFPKLGWILMAGLTLGGIITNFLISYINEFAGSHLSGSMKSGTDYNKIYYWPTYCRFIPYLAGVGLGYILVDLKNKSRKVNYSKVLTRILWLVTAFLMIFTLCIVHIFQQSDYEYEPVGAAFYNSLGKPVWAAGISLFIYLCVTGHGGIINSLLSWEGFQPLGRLSYGVYLVHRAVQRSLSNSTRTNMYLADITLIPSFISDAVISIFFAGVLSLVFESPFIILEKELLGGRKKPSAPLPVVHVSRPAEEKKAETTDKTKDGEPIDEVVKIEDGSKTVG